MWESNPPGPFVTPHTGFEVQRGHQAPCPPRPDIVSNERLCRKALEWVEKSSFVFEGSSLVAELIENVGAGESCADHGCACYFSGKFIRRSSAWKRGSERKASNCGITFSWAIYVVRSS